MKRFLSILCSFILSNIVIGQITAQFEVLNDGNVYCVVRNYNDYVTTFSWAAVNDALGQQRTGQYNMRPGEIAYFGPSTIGWVWQQGEVFYYSTAGSNYSVSFRGAQTGYTGPCKEYITDRNGNKMLCPCKGEITRQASGLCSNCPHYRTSHTWHN